jgi:hypothetical protein
MDIDAATIAFAAAAYPSVKFVAADVTSAGELFPLASTLSTNSTHFTLS